MSPSTSSNDGLTYRLFAGIYTIFPGVGTVLGFVLHTGGADTWGIDPYRAGLHLLRHILRIVITVYIAKH